jgi:putative ABC transport system substrate-binding protein
MKRRQFILLLSGGALAGLTSVSAQQPGPPRRIGVVMLYPDNDPQGQLRAEAFRSQLEKSGWKIGGNLQIDFQWGTGDVDWIRAATARALQSSPEVLLANGDAAFAAQQLAKRIPVVFIGSADPVGDGLVQSFAHPGGNITGFGVQEPTLGAKLLGLLKQIAPNTTRVAVLVNPDNRTNTKILALLEADASRYNVKIVSAAVREAPEIETAMAEWGKEPNCGVIVPSGPVTNSRRKMIIELAERYRLPTIYSLRSAVTDGGLISYGADVVELFRQAAIYTDRILRGEKPAELPVQLPTKFEMVVNMKTAKALGLEIPASLQATADEVIE